MSPMKFLIYLTLIVMSGYAYDSMQTICDSPRVYYFTHFLTPAECDHIIEKARPQLKRSTVLDSGAGAIDYRRTSEGVFFPSNPSDRVLKAIEKRIANLTKYPVENGEGLQVLHYQKGGEYRPHYDYFSASQAGGSAALIRGGQRVMTLIMYLNDPERGGETIFPLANASVNPRKGCAVLFYNVTPDGADDPRSLHGGAPVLEGEKWIMTKWIRERPFH